ncbi:MAG: lipopolysaccharide kinase InaA family protein [Campylobacterota bacterium]|nr:lipopolysaccharide kinase InaA family protein [Campylobacterota bacterium]
MGIKFSINEKYPSFEAVLLNIKTYFDASSESIHKARNELRIATIENEKLVIKAFKVPHLINQFAYAYLRDGKARKSYDNAITLQALHVNTPEPIGLIEFYRFGLLKESYFIAKHEPYDFTIREAFHHKIEDHQDVIKAFAAFTYDLHVKGVWHVDYSPGNILITREAEGYKFSLVDINRMEFKTIESYEGLNNFAKFWAKEEDLMFLAQTYAVLAGLDEDKAVNIALNAAQKLQAKTNLKRKLKGQ